jgi:Zn-dependent membrane protease YugP
MNFTFDQRLRLAAILIVVGLLIEAWTLSWNSPIGFLVFLGIGGIFIALGIVIYLLALVSLPAEQDSSTPNS